MKYVLAKFLVFLTLLIGLDVLASSPLPVPTLDFHKEFLVGSWNPNAPTIVVFKDPFCPYCLKALEKKEELENVNLFLFWYPIFGEKSDKRVAEFFLCNSPVEAKVLNAVLAHASPNCSGKRRAELETINREFYEAYSPPGVPAFYLGGRKVSFAEVKSIQSQGNSGVNIEWSRYSLNRLNSNPVERNKAALYLSESMPEEKVRKIIEILVADKEYDWYLFASKSNQLSDKVCSIANFDCASDKEKMLMSSQELALLFGLESVMHSQFIINGKLTSPSHLSNDLQKIVSLAH